MFLVPGPSCSHNGTAFAIKTIIYEKIAFKKITKDFFRYPHTRQVICQVSRAALHFTPNHRLVRLPTVRMAGTLAEGR